jgi:hypothetical protein
MTASLYDGMFDECPSFRTISLLAGQPAIQHAGWPASWQGCKKVGRHANVMA